MGRASGVQDGPTKSSCPQMSTVSRLKTILDLDKPLDLVFQLPQERNINISADNLGLLGYQKK